MERLLLKLPLLRLEARKQMRMTLMTMRMTLGLILMMKWHLMERILVMSPEKYVFVLISGQLVLCVLLAWFYMFALPRISHLIFSISLLKVKMVLMGYINWNLRWSPGWWGWFQRGRVAEGRAALIGVLLNILNVDSCAVNPTDKWSPDCGNLYLDHIL